MPDTRTLAVVTRWLGVSLERVVDVGAPEPAHTIVHHAGETTPDIVEAHLRADPHLEPQIAAALGRIFRAAYEQFAHTPTTQHETDAPSQRDQPSAPRRRPHHGGPQTDEQDATAGDEFRRA